MESIWWRRRYEGKDENEGGGASRVKINKLVQGLKGGISEKSEPDFSMPQAAFFIIIIFACMTVTVQLLNESRTCVTSSRLQTPFFKSK